jgi:hypothetical protein
MNNFFYGCKKDDETNSLPNIEDGAINYNLKNVVQKGPFISGSTVNIQELNYQLILTGNSCNFQAINVIEFSELIKQISLILN